ncbi:hypothetical protein PSU4_26920 [Pseudonocardia sulfidoxydans NBRC 16205]|uniref:Uncharacterized protein n=1 Tax=Pseudonocardia sulfidoxydans NBRC 16205 TaxID=1223511 RepID=A0A511DL11_9PSEU|nr:hypothetical protein PSU4_26920 [Pseudonocardia sulfidoxydans NBRC 16205]
MTGWTGSLRGPGRPTTATRRGTGRHFHTSRTVDRLVQKDPTSGSDPGVAGGRGSDTTGGGADAADLRQARRQPSTTGRRAGRNREDDRCRVQRFKGSDATGSIDRPERVT